MGDEKRKNIAVVSPDQPLMSQISPEGLESVFGPVAIDVYKGMADDQLKKLLEIIRSENKQIPPGLKIILLGREIS